MGKCEDATIDIIYQDDDVIVLNKPTGISVTKDRSGKDDLPTVLSEQLGLSEGQELRLVHRLDKDTSGVLVIAKNMPAQSWLSSCFEKGLARKTYLTIVQGGAIEQEGVIEAQLASMEHERNKMQVVSKHGKEAVTEWKLLADFGTLSLVAAYPLTGRTHQIRVHMLSAGMPLAIDPVYGGSKGIYLSEIKQGYKIPKGQEEQPLMDRLTLHAYQLRVPLKEGAEASLFIASLDEKFKATIKMLSKHNKRSFAAFTQEGVFEKIMSGQAID